MIIAHHTHELTSVFTHTHEACEIQYCVSGSCTYHYIKDGCEVEKRVFPGLLIFNPKGMPHGVTNVKQPYDRYWMQFTDEELISIQGSTDLLNKLMSQEGEPQPLFWDLSANHEVFDDIFEKAYGGFMNVCRNRQWNHMYLACYTALLFCEINRCYPLYFEGLMQAGQTRVISSVKQYLDEHYAEPIKLTELSEQFHFSQNYLTRQFTRQIGMSPRQYLTQKRLSMARKDLSSTTKSVQEIAVSNGFGDVNFFIQLFKKTYGSTPKQYQQRMQNPQI